MWKNWNPFRRKTDGTGINEKENASTPNAWSSQYSESYCLPNRPTKSDHLDPDQSVDSGNESTTNYNQSILSRPVSDLRQKSSIQRRLSLREKTGMGLQDLNSSLPISRPEKRKITISPDQRKNSKYSRESDRSFSGVHGPLLSSSPIMPKVRNALETSAGLRSEGESTIEGRSVGRSASFNYGSRRNPAQSTAGQIPWVRLKKRESLRLADIASGNTPRSPNTVKLSVKDSSSLLAPPSFKTTPLIVTTDTGRSRVVDTQSVVTALREKRKRYGGPTTDELTMDETWQNSAKRRRQDSSHSNVSSISIPPMPEALPNLMLPTGSSLLHIENMSERRPSTVPAMDSFSDVGLGGDILSASTNISTRQPTQKSVSTPTSGRSVRRSIECSLSSSLRARNKAALLERNDVNLSRLLKDKALNASRRQSFNSDVTMLDGSIEESSKAVTSIVPSPSTSSISTVSLTKMSESSEPTPEIQQTDTISSAVKRKIAEGVVLRKQIQSGNLTPKAVSGFQRAKIGTEEVSCSDIERDRKAEFQRRVLDLLDEEPATTTNAKASDQSSTSSSDSSTSSSTLNSSGGFSINSTASSSIAATAAKTSIAVSATLDSLNAISEGKPKLLTSNPSVGFSLPNVVPPVTTQTTEAKSASIDNGTATFLLTAPLSTKSLPASTSSSNLPGGFQFGSVSTAVGDSKTLPSGFSFGSKSTASVVPSISSLVSQSPLPVSAPTLNASINISFDAISQPVASTTNRSLPSAPSAGFQFGAALPTNNPVSSTGLNLVGFPLSTNSQTSGVSLSTTKAGIVPQTTSSASQGFTISNAFSGSSANPSFNFSGNQLGSSGTTGIMGSSVSSTPSSVSFGASTSAGGGLQPTHSSNLQTQTSFGQMPLSGFNFNTSVSSAQPVSQSLASVSFTSQPNSNPLSLTTKTSIAPAVFGSSLASSTPFAFGLSSASNATNTAPPAYGALSTTSLTSKPSFNFGAPSTQTPAFGSANTTTSGLSIFGSAGSSTVTALPAPVLGITNTSTPVFSSSTTASTPNFGTANKSLSMFGSSAASTQIFGAGTNSAPAFGSNTANSFGASTNNAPLFAATKPNTQPSFGTAANGNISTLFGATATAAPAFGSTKTTTATVFGAPAASTSSTSIFGASTSFGITSANHTSTPFGATQLGSSNAFGSTTTTASMFGLAPATTPSIFGAATASPSIFGASTSATPSMFGSATTTAAPSMFGTAVSTKPQTSFSSPFGATTISSTFGKPTPSFGSSAVATPAPAFGSSQPFNFGATNTTTSQQNQPFGSSNQSTAAQNLFGVQKPTASASVFGATSAFGAATTTAAAAPTVFGSPASSAFGGPKTPGTFVFGSTNPSNQPAAPVFGSAQPSQAPAFGTGQAANTASPFGQPSQTNTNFGTPKQNNPFGTPAGTGVFNFGVSQSSGSTPAFNEQTPKPSTGFNFSGAVQPGQTTFNFSGQQPSGPVFQTPTQNATSPSVGFNFSAGAAANPNFSFGGTQSPATPNMFTPGVASRQRATARRTATRRGRR